jgi:hypothetical protein
MESRTPPEAGFLEFLIIEFFRMPRLLLLEKR